MSQPVHRQPRPQPQPEPDGDAQLTALAGASLDHVALTVSDLDSSVAFYTRLGFREVMRWHEGPEVCADGLGIPGADIELCHLAGAGFLLELMVYHAPQGAALRSPAPNNTGTAHVALLVDDIDALYDQLVAAGIPVVSPPVRDPSADSFQAIDPDGIRIEFITRSGNRGLPPTAIVKEP